MFMSLTFQHLHSMEDKDSFCRTCFTIFVAAQIGCGNLKTRNWCAWRYIWTGSNQPPKKRPSQWVCPRGVVVDVAGWQSIFVGWVCEEYDVCTLKRQRLLDAVDISSRLFLLLLFMLTISCQACYKRVRCEFIGRCLEC